MAETKKKSIGGLDPEVKGDFDAYQAQVEAANASEALAKLLEAEKVSSTVIALEGSAAKVRGMVRQSYDRFLHDIDLALILDHEMVDAEHAELADKIEELTQSLAERDATIAGQATELDELRAKAATVDGIAQAMREAADAAAEREAAHVEREKAQAERIDKMCERFDKQMARCEAELDEAKGKVDRLAPELADAKDLVDQTTAERDAAQAKIAEVEAERDALAEQVAELRKRLADVEQAGS